MEVCTNFSSVKGWVFVGAQPILHGPCPYKEPEPAPPPQTRRTSPNLILPAHSELWDTVQEYKVYTVCVPKNVVKKRLH